MPYGEYTISENLCISKPNVKIHGSILGTKLIFTDGSRLISSKNPTSSSDTTRFSYGLDNILLEDFTITGDGQIEMTLGNNTVLRNIRVENTFCTKPGAFRFILPNKIPVVSGLTVIDCSTFKTWWHGFQINAAVTGTYIIEDILFEDCKAEYAGYEYEGRGIRSDGAGNWSVGFDLAENYGGSMMTVKDMIVKNCISEYCWESGFHMENNPTKINVLIENCESNYNGQKNNYVDITGKTYYCSGFLISSSGVIIKNCEANYNTRYGYYCVNEPVFIDNIGTGNGEALCKNCVGCS